MKLVKSLLLIFELVAMVSTSRGADQFEIFSPEKGKDPAHSAMLHAVKDFEDVSVSRSQLLSQFQSIVTNNPSSEYQAWAKQTAEILNRMITEDERHVAVAPANLNSVTIEERVRELIFELRDQNGKEFSIFADQNGKTNTPAEQLVAISYSAVPQLIKVIDDSTLTRSLKVSWFRETEMDSSVSYKILTVGDCAVSIIEKIAGRSFKQTITAETQKVVEEWWAEFQKKGEEQMLVEGTEIGNGDSPTQAKMLIDRYPDVALTSLIKGTRAATNNVYTREGLLRFFEKYDSPEAIAFLDEELHEGFSVSPLVAAGILNRKGRNEGVTMMIQEWEKTRRDLPEYMTGPSQLERFLASVDSPDAIAALGKNLQAHSLNTRMTIVDTIGRGGSEWYGPPVPKHSAATLAATEDFFVTALQDDNSGIADTAGSFLHQLWPERYAFDSSASFKIQERQRIECQNVWRQAHQLTLLPFPPSPTNHVSTNEAVKVTTIVWETGTVKPSDAFVARVEAFRDKLLTATNFVDFLAEYAAKPEPNTAGLAFNARKDEDLTGVTLFVCLLPGIPPNPGQGCHVDFGVTLGQKSLYGGASGGDIDFFGNDSRAWTDLAASIATAIAGPAEMPFTINFRLVSNVKYMELPN